MKRGSKKEKIKNLNGIAFSDPKTLKSAFSHA